MCGIHAPLASLALVMWFGFARDGDPENIVWTLGIYAVAALATALFIDRPALVWGGPALLLVTLWQGIVYRWADALGLPHVVARLRALRGEKGERFEPCALLVTKAERGESFTG